MILWYGSSQLWSHGLNTTMLYGVWKSLLTVVKFHYGLQMNMFWHFCPCCLVLNDLNLTPIHFKECNSLFMSVVLVTFPHMVLTWCVLFLCVCFSSTCRTLKAATGRSSTARGWVAARRRVRPVRSSLETSSSLVLTSLRTHAKVHACTKIC